MVKNDLGLSDSSLLFATAFYHATGKSPNAWTISEKSKLDMYYRCMVVCYASLRRLYEEAQLVLFTNQELPEPFNSQLSLLGVKTVFCSSRFVDDSVFINGFPGCLFTLDVIEHLAKVQLTDFDCLILLDNDCIVRHRLDGMLNDVTNHQAIYAYEPGYPVNMVANGQSRASLTLALSYMQGQIISIPIPLYGGEFYAIPAKLLPDIAQHIQTFWDWMKAEGKTVFGDNLTEEHVMSVALAMNNHAVSGAESYVKRIWTTDHFSTVDGGESKISVWHLPSEKKKGFARLYRYWVEHNGFDGLDSEGFTSLVDKMVPLHIAANKSLVSLVLQRARSAVKYLLTGRL